MAQFRFFRIRLLQTCQFGDYNILFVVVDLHKRFIYLILKRDFSFKRREECIQSEPEIKTASHILYE